MTGQLRPRDEHWILDTPAPGKTDAHPFAEITQRGYRTGCESRQTACDHIAGDAAQILLDIPAQGA